MTLNTKARELEQAMEADAKAVKETVNQLMVEKDNFQSNLIDALANQ